MKAYLELSQERRRRVCEEAGVQLGLAPGSVEKDFWICWTLRELFALRGIGDGLTFKGGTSLSKGWGLIHRFSEDIDVVISRTLLGFSGDSAPDAPNLSGKEQEKRLHALAERCQQFVADVVLPALAKRLPEGATRSARSALAIDPTDPARQTILFHYPSEFGATAYVRPVVKIELGARSDVDPVETPELSPYLAAVLPSIAPFKVATVSPTRTFWEKAMLLHEANARKEPGKPKDRLSRHYYDLWCLISNGVAETASNDVALFEAVANHRRVYFRKSRVAQDSLRRGTLRIVPGEEHVAAWRTDFEAMRESMFFQDPLEFAAILDIVRKFETAFNVGT